MGYKHQQPIRIHPTLKDFFFFTFILPVKKHIEIKNVFYKGILAKTDRHRTFECNK